MGERGHCKSCAVWQTNVECGGVDRSPVPRIRAALRLLSPDDITPAGVRALERVLDAEESS